MNYEQQVIKLVDELATEIHLNAFQQSQDFEALKQSILTATSSTIESIDAFMTVAIAQGATPDNAAICAKVFMMGKYMEAQL